MDIGEVEAHRATLGNLLCFVEIGVRAGLVALYGAKPCTSEQGAWKIIRLSRFAKAIHRRFDARMRGVD